MVEQCHLSIDMVMLTEVGTQVDSSPGDLYTRSALLVAVHPVEVLKGCFFGDFRSHNANLDEHLAKSLKLHGNFFRVFSGGQLAYL